MPNSEKVSVVIPLYNAAPFIAETIGSILAQTFTDIHIYVVDDLSTDGSDTIVKDIAKKEARVSYHLMPKKGGCPAPTKNEGARITKGLYVAFCDHDDWWHPEKLARQVAYLDAHPEVNVLGCNVEIVDTDQHRTLGTFWRNPTEFSPETIRQIVLDGPIFATTTCMIIRREYTQAHPFDERFIGSDEYDLSLHAALDDPSQVASLPETLAYWRWHNASLSHSDKAANRALKDERLFAEKVLSRTDLSDNQKAQVRARVTMVTRRAANAELASNHLKEAITYYKIAAAQSDTLSSLMLPAIKLAPSIARAFVTWKRTHSHAQPTFR